jgi:hypothetical protein
MAPDFKIKYQLKGKDVTEKFSENPSEGKTFKNIEPNELTPVVTVTIKVRENANLAGDTHVLLAGNFVGDSNPDYDADSLALYLDVRD